jgi:16S rRNA (cytosine1402-N4)-methyltransferase
MTWSDDYHAPVLAREVLELLGHARFVLDGTLGGGGHAAALLDRGVRILAVDRDPDAIARASDRLQPHIEQGLLKVHRASFRDAAALIPDNEPLDGVLLDLGVSSHQLDTEDRGFTFRRGAPLDMRMGDDAPMTAAEFLNNAEQREIERVLHDYADEHKARRMAAEIVKRRQSAPFETSDDLVAAIRAVHGPRSGPSEFARVFQGIRIAINDEFPALTEALERLRDRLAPEGIFAVITYHSGEDRIVKNAFRDWSRDCVCPPQQPFCTWGGWALGSLVSRKPFVPTAAQVKNNPRARSAHLRAWRKAA